MAFRDGPMIASFLWYLDLLSFHKKRKGGKNKKKMLSKLDPLWQNYLDPGMKAVALLLMIHCSLLLPLFVVVLSLVLVLLYI